MSSSTRLRVDEDGEVGGDDTAEEEGVEVSEE